MECFFVSHLIVTDHDPGAPRLTCLRSLARKIFESSCFPSTSSRLTHTSSRTVMRPGSSSFLRLSTCAAGAMGTLTSAPGAATQARTARRKVMPRGAGCGLRVAEKLKH